MVRIFVLIVAVSLALVACGGEAGTPVSAEPPSDTPPETPVENPAPPPDTPPEPPAPSDPLPPPPAGAALPGPERVVLSIVSEGGFVPVEVALARVPSIVIYDDGTIVRPGPIPEIYPGPLLVPLEVGRLSEEALANLLDDAASSDAFKPGIDFGFPGVTDLDSTEVTVRIDGDPRSASAYALYEEFVNDPALSEAESEARGELMRVVSAAFGAAAQVAEWTSPRLAEIVVWTLPYFEREDIDAGPDIAWPLNPKLIAIDEDVGRGCAELNERRSAKVLQAALGATQLSPWRVGEEQRQLVIRPRLLESDVCLP